MVANPIADRVLDEMVGSIFGTSSDKGHYRARLTLHPGQGQILDSKTRFRVVACGRRWGKTETGKVAALETAQNGGVVWWIMPNYPMAIDLWRDIKFILNGNWKEKHEQERQLVLDGGGILRIRSGDDPDSLRGAGLDLAVLDEAAFIRGVAWTDAIRPALSDRQGRALFLSTPKGIGNYFFKLYGLGLDPAESEWECWTFPTSSNPLIKPEEIESARQLLPDRLFRQEYLAEFTDDASGVFRGVLKVSTGTPIDAPIKDHIYVMGLDWAKENDFTCLSVFDATTMREVYLDRFNGVNWSLQRGRVMAANEKFKPLVIWAEENSIGGPNIEALQTEGAPVTPFQTTATSKGPLIESLALGIEREELTLLNDPIATAEAQAYELERLPSGRFRYGAPVGMHDDTVIARALGWHGCHRTRALTVDSNPFYGEDW